MRPESLTRRSLLRSAAIGSTAVAMAIFAKPFVHGAAAAGTLNVELWDHWVPGGNEPWKRLAREWGDSNKVDVRLDFITSQGDKLNLTIAAEAQAGAGHDILHLSDAQPGAYTSRLEPVGDIVSRSRGTFWQSCWKGRGLGLFETIHGERCRYRRAR